MRRWGLVVTVFYAALVMAFLIPATAILVGERWRSSYRAVYGDGTTWPWIWGALLITAQVLLFLRVDRSWRRVRPRADVIVTAIGMSASVALLSFALIAAPLAAIYGDDRWPAGLDAFLINAAAVWLGLWAFWSLIFSAYYWRAPAAMARTVGWLIKGSILELLVAVPAHVIVRRRQDCSAPAVTAFGIITGTAIMLMCFGPSVVALFEHRRSQYRRDPPARPAHSVSIESHR